MPAALVAALKAAISGTPTLEQSLAVVDALYPGRLEILDSARASARDSDRSGFQHGEKALELLRILAGNYWTQLADGKGDQYAKACFGKNSFAAKESDSLSSDGRRRRTFQYGENEILMEKHLKHGVKDSYAETLRIHLSGYQGNKRL